MLATMWKSIKSWVRNCCQKWPCILFGAIYWKNKQCLGHEIFSIENFRLVSFSPSLVSSRNLREKQSFWHYCYFLKLKLGDFSCSQNFWKCYVFVSFRFRNLNDVYSQSRLNNPTATFTLLEVIIVDLLQAIIHTLLVTHWEVHFAGILRVSLTFVKSSPWH